YYIFDSQYWERRGIPQVPGKLILGVSQLLLKRSEPRILVLKEWTKIYGRTYGLKEGSKNVLVTSDPDVINEIFVKQFDNFYGRRSNILGPDPDKDLQVNLFQSRGRRWKRLRALSVPTFSVSSLKKIRQFVEGSATSMVEIMEERHGDGAPFNIHPFFCEFTMDAISKLVLGQKETQLFENPRIRVVQGMFLRDFDHPIVHTALAFPSLVPIIRSILSRVDTSISKDARQFRSEIIERVQNRILEREEFPEIVGQARDMLDMFLDASVESDGIEAHDGFKLTESKTTKTLSVDEVVMQVVIFILAGFDTTSNALAYTVWMLANNPEVMKKCQEEIDECCQEDSISYEDLNKLKYIEATCKETLRLEPFGSISNSRTCMNSTTVCGIDIEKDTWIEVDAYTLHIDKEIWGEDADEFRPERWLEPGFHVPQHVYGAFGGGPRICIGQRLGLMEEKLVLAHLLRKWTIVKANPEQKELRVHGAIIVTPIEVPVRMVPRD
ncbi:hypothetical protein PFISCL1PPCAC_11300, partial [Pristionchus fissidentatus]